VWEILPGGVGNYAGCPEILPGGPAALLMGLKASKAGLHKKQQRGCQQKVV